MYICISYIYFWLRYLFASIFISSTKQDHRPWTWTGPSSSVRTCQWTAGTRSSWNGPPSQPRSDKMMIIFFSNLAISLCGFFFRVSEKNNVVSYMLLKKKNNQYLLVRNIIILQSFLTDSEDKKPMGLCWIWRDVWFQTAFQKFKKTRFVFEEV